MRIKNILFLFTCLCFSTLFVQAQNKSFQLSGKVKGVEPFTSIYVYMMNEEGTSFKANVANNSFLLKGEVTQPTICKVIFGGTSQFTKGDENSFLPYKCSCMWLVIAPNDKLEINGDLTGKDFVDLYYTGNEANKKLSDLMSKLFPTMNLHGRNAVFLMKNKNLETDKLKNIREQQRGYSELEDKIKIDFLNKNYNSIAALWLMEDMIIRSQITFDKLIPIFKKVDKKKFGKCQYYTIVEQRINAYINIAVGKPCPEIISNESFDDSVFKLSTLKGKYVIIDFWGTWCGPCVKSVPSMKAFRDKNADKVEILGIAKDSNKPYWKKIITDKEMNWPNILNGKNEKDFVSSFNVQGYPTKILIDPNGIIRYRETGESETFYTNIDLIINGEKKDKPAISNEICRVVINATNYPTDQILFSATNKLGEIKRYTVNLSHGKGYLDIPTTLNQRVFIQNMDKKSIINTPEGNQVMPILSNFFAEPGKEITISFNHLEWPKIEIKGTLLNDDYTSLIDTLAPLQKEERELLKKLFISSDDKENEIINNNRQLLKKKLFDTEFNYLCANPSKKLSLIIAKDKSKAFTSEQMGKLSSLLHPYWENSQELNSIEEQIKIQKRIQIGNDAPHFYKVDKDGKKISLSDFKGKYVLIDFWGTWCAPCRKSHPHLNALYEKFHPKGLELIGVASEGKNANQNKWLSAIEEDQLQGHQILNDIDAENCDMVKLFNINAFPTKIVLSPTGKIAYIAVGSGEAIDTFLEKTFGKLIK